MKKQKFLHQHYMEDEETRKKMDKVVPRNELSSFIRKQTARGVEEELAKKKHGN